MLPFLRKPKASGLIVEQRKSDKPNEPSEMEACAQDLLNAIEAKDVKAIAQALQAACELSEYSEAAEEGDSE